MIISFKAICTNRRKDGTYPVRIRVTFKGKSRKLPTTLSCSPADLTRTLRIKSVNIMNKADELIAEMRRAVQDISPFDLEIADVDWVVGIIRQKMTEQHFSLDFFEWADSFLKGKSEGTRATYVQALNAFERYLGERKMDINAINRSMLLGFIDAEQAGKKMTFIRQKGELVVSSKEKAPRGTAYRYISKLGHIFSAAKDKYNDEDSGLILIPRSPFSSISVDAPFHQGQKSLGVEVMQAVISAQTDNEKERCALDAFIISFALMGANLADLFSARAEDIKDGRWHYNRQKTRTRREDKAEMVVQIPEELLPFIERMKTSGGWWLGALHVLGKEKDRCGAVVNQYLKRWAKRNGIPEFTFYAGRHSWATIARKAGIEMATISRCLCHQSEYRTTDIYAEVDWSLLAEANKRVLSLFNW